MACKKRKHGGLVGKIQRDIKKRRKESPVFNLGYQSAKRSHKRENPVLKQKRKHKFNF